jgi:hypothetical protein
VVIDRYALVLVLASLLSVATWVGAYRLFLLVLGWWL